MKMANKLLKKLALSVVSLLLIFGLFGAVSASPLTNDGSADFVPPKLFVIDDVDYGDTYFPGDVIPVEITLANLADSNDLKDITVKVWLEDDQGKRIGDRLEYEIKRMHQDDEKTFVIEVPVPADTVEDIYNIVITADAKWEETGWKVSDSWNGEVEIEQKEHALLIENVQLGADSITNGEQLNIAVTIANTGLNDESGIQITAGIPELGVEKTVSVLKTLNTGYDYTAYMTFDIPADATDGLYTFVLTTYNLDSGDKYEQNINIESVQQNSVTQTTGLVAQTAEVGKGSVFSIEIQNNENVMKTYDLAVGGVADWATARVDPVKLTLNPGDSQVVYVYLMPTKAGQHAFTLFVEDNGAVVAANQISVNVMDNASAIENTDMQNLFAVLVLVFVILVAGYLYKKEKFGGKTAKQVYY